jgi:hypothetical protein
MKVAYRRAVVVLLIVIFVILEEGFSINVCGWFY